MKTIIILFASLFLSAHAFAAGLQNISYDAPVDWIELESEDPTLQVFQTSFDSNKRLFIVMRFVDTEDKSPEEWVKTETEALEKESGAVYSDAPVTKRFGEHDWTYLEWAQAEQETRGRKYYFVTETADLIEVAVAAKEEIFDRTDLSMLDSFFASFKMTN